MATVLKFYHKSEFGKISSSSVVLAMEQKTLPDYLHFQALTENTFSYDLSQPY